MQGDPLARRPMTYPTGRESKQLGEQGSPPAWCSLVLLRLPEVPFSHLPLAYIAVS